MKLSELMAKIEVKPTFSGPITADDYCMAIGFADTDTDPKTYLVAQGGITEQSGTLEATTSESTYLRSGTVETKTGTKRSFKLAGDRISGDEFQEALLAHKIKYGTGQEVIKPYVYFCVLTGKGEEGTLSIKIEDEPSGGAGNNAGFSATLSACGTPKEYTWTAAQ